MMFLDGKSRVHPGGCDHKELQLYQRSAIGSASDLVRTHGLMSEAGPAMDWGSDGKDEDYV